MSKKDGIETHTSPRSLHISLWISQVLLFLIFAGGGVWKLVTPRQEIAAMMPWVGEVSPSFFYTTAVLDLLGGLGLLLPSLTKVRPELTHWAAVGCVGLMLAAVLFHVSRGEASNTPFNFVLLAMSAFVFWGRRFSAPLH